MFSTVIPLRWSDLDPQGHVNNAKVVDYLQEARVAFLRSGPASALLDSGVVVVGHQVEYRNVVEYLADPKVEVTLGVSALGAARIELAYEMRQHGGLVAQARTLLCPFDFTKQRPVRLSPEYRSFFAAHQMAAEPLRKVSGDVGERFTSIPLPLRWSDLDSYGHINNVMVFDHLQQARITATTRWAPELARLGTVGGHYRWLVVRQDVDYIKQLAHRITPYEVRIALAGIGNSSLHLASHIVDPEHGTACIQARTILVCADQEGHKSELPANLREELGRYL